MTDTTIPPPPGASLLTPTQTTSTPILTPINLLLLALFALLFYLRTRPAYSQTSSSSIPAPPPPPILFKTYTPPTLLPNSGQNGTPVLLAIRGRVFDVSSGRNFYGPGGPYENFAGRDATRGLAFGSFDEDMLTADLRGPLDGLEGFGEEQWEALRGWEERFEGKYLVVGRLVAVGCEDEGR